MLIYLSRFETYSFKASEAETKSRLDKTFLLNILS